MHWFTGVVTTFAGTGDQGFQDGPSGEASFYEPNGVCVDGSGCVYVADTFNHKIRKISPEGEVCTVAGSGEAGFREGQGQNACFNWPRGVAVNSQGTIFVADTSNHRIRMISPQGEVSTLAGSGEGECRDGDGQEACFMQPYGVTVDAEGNVLVADTDNNSIRKITPNGVVTTLLSGRQSESKHATIMNEESWVDDESCLSGPVGVAVDGEGNVLVVDTANHRICKLPQCGYQASLRFSGIDPYSSLIEDVDIHATCLSYLESIRAGDLTTAKHILMLLRKAVLALGINNQGKDLTNTRYTTRGLTWKILLGVFAVDVEIYLAALAQGPSDKYAKIRDDSFRTFQTSIEFQGTVPECEIVRVLNSHALQPQQRYVQGLNLICGPMLYCMSELDTFFAFEKIIDLTSFYWRSNYIGAQAGCVLVDCVLAEVDKELSDHLKNKGLSAFIYAFPCVSSFSAAVRPFNELLHLWDFLLACGLHFNVMCVSAQILLLRAELIAADKPKQILDYRVWPSLHAKTVVDLVLKLTPLVSDSLWDDIVQHIHNPLVVERLTGRSPD